MRFLSTSPSSIYTTSSIVLPIILFGNTAIRAVAGQEQEGNQDPGGDEGGSGVQNGYFSYVSDMDSAEAVREAMETLSWASKGSSWMMEASTSEQLQATPSSSSSEAAAVVVHPTNPGSAGVVVQPTQAASVANTSSNSSHSNNTLAIGLGVGVPLAVLSISAVAGVLVYKKRKATRKDFERRTANLRDMTQAEV